MYSGVLYSFTIGFVAAILFLLVDKYEPKGPLAPLLKFLILFVVAWRSCTNCSPTVLHCFSRDTTLMNCRKRGVRSLRLGHRHGGARGNLARKQSLTRKTIPELQ